MAQIEALFRCKHLMSCHDDADPITVIFDTERDLTIRGRGVCKDAHAMKGACQNIHDCLAVSILFFYLSRNLQQLLLRREQGLILGIIEPAPLMDYNLLK